jgi:hypothetical protein
MSAYGQQLTFGITKATYGKRQKLGWNHTVSEPQIVLNGHSARLALPRPPIILEEIV